MQTLDKYTFGVRRSKWREIFREKGLSGLREWVFSPATSPRESKSKLVKHWQFWETYSSDLLSTLSVVGPVTSKKAKRRPPIQSKEFRSTHSSQSSHTGYYQRYYFVYILPSDYQRKQNLK